ncbi:MAG: hypothetical protein AMXMBFR84_08690 [Candidatus Hydrogenedentota bacterium]
MSTTTTHGSSWGFVCGRASACEGRLLSEDFFLSIASLVQIEDILRQLNDTPLRDFLTPGADWEDWSAVIDRYFHQHVLSIRQDCPKPEVADIFLIRDDYQNLKTALLGNRELPFPPLYLTAEQLVPVANGDISALPSPFKESASRALRSLESTRNQACVDAILDGAYLRHLQAFAAALNVSLIHDYTEAYVLSRVVLAMWREYRAGRDVQHYVQHALPLGSVSAMAQVLADAGDPKGWGDVLTGKVGEVYRQANAVTDGEEVQRFEDLIMNYLINIATKGYGQVAGPERVFAYLRVLASETHNLKLVVCGRMNRIDSTVLKRRLRRKNG